MKKMFCAIFILAVALFCFGINSITVFASQTITTVELSYEDGFLVISGITNPKAQTTTIVENSDGNILYVKQMESHIDGSYIFTTRVADGQHNVRVGGEYVQESVGKMMVGQLTHQGVSIVKTDEKVTASVTITNPTLGEKKGSVALAAFLDQRLAYVDFEYAVIESGKSDTVELTLDVNDKNSIYSYRAFVWSDHLSTLPFHLNSDLSLTANLWQQFYISTEGDDQNDGSLDKPFKTIKRAQQTVREIAPNMEGDIVVNIAPGNYYLQDTLDFEQQDSGTNGHRVIYRGQRENKPVISGGKPIKADFQPNPSNPNIWEAYVEGLEQPRALYINDAKYYPARETRLVKGIGDYNDPSTPEQYDGIYMKKRDLGFYENPEDIEFHWFIQWNMTVAHLTDIIQDPKNEEQVIAMMTPGLWNTLQTNNTYGLEATDGQAGLHFWIQNAYELLDTPGEFYYNRQTKLLSFVPYPNIIAETAEVIVPYLDKIMRIYGNQEKVKDITFEGLKFAHAENYSLSRGDLKTSQGSCVNYDSNWLTAAYPGTITLDRTDGVSFKDNYFFGFANPGVVLRNGVSNTEIVGNAFSDMGHSSIVVGDVYRHADNFGTTSGTVVDGNSPEPVNPLSQFNMINGRMGDQRTPGSASCAASYWGNLDYSLRDISGGELWYSETKYKTYHNKSWFSDPRGPLRGDKAWVAYEFDKPVSLSEVILRFDTSKISAPQRTGYEVLLSNERDFPEGRYITVAVQSTAANSVMRYPVSDTLKYRFLMIRTLGATQFGITSVLALTPDVAHTIWAEKCRDNIISDNRIERSATEILGGDSILGYYAKNTKILRNEILNTARGGISWGYGWGFGAIGHEDNYISNNYIHDITRFTNDGAGIYTLSPQRGTVISNNYVDKLWQSVGAFYLDQASSYLTLFNNVGTNLAKVLYIWAPDSRENYLYNNYSTTTEASAINNGQPDKDGIINYLDPPSIFLQGNPSPEAYHIMKNAGMGKRFDHIKNWIAPSEYKLPVEIDRFRALHISEQAVRPRVFTTNDEIGQNILNSGKFGNVLGAYPWEYRYELLEARDFYQKNFDFSPLTNSGHIRTDTIDTEEYLAFIDYRNVVYKGSEVIPRCDLMGTIAYCENLIVRSFVIPDGTVGNSTIAENGPMYYHSDIKQFEDKLEEIKTKKTFMIAQEYSLVLELEDALLKLDQKRLDAELLYLYVENANKVVVDSNKKEVLVRLKKGEMSILRKISPIISGKAELVGSYSAMSFDSDNQISIKNIATGEIAHWKVKAQEEEHDESSVITPNKWNTNGPKNESCNGIIPMNDGSVLLSNNYHPYISKEYSDELGGATVYFDPGKLYKNRSFSFILGANSWEDFKINDKSSSSNRLELFYEADNFKLYMVINGTKILISEQSATLDTGTANTLNYSIKASGAQSEVTINLNHAPLFNESIPMPVYGNFFGYHSPEVSMRIL